MSKKGKLDIIYEDKYFLVVNKPSGLLTVSTDKEKEKTLFHKVLEYEKKKNKSNKIFILHRLDKDTSGIVILAKDQKLKFTMQNNWNELVKLRSYVAVVEGTLEKESDTIKSYLAEDKTLKTYITNSKKGNLAVTKYRVVSSNNKYSLLDIEIKTGRKNQIRVHMKDNKTPILGDHKYGKKDGYRTMMLLANRVMFVHPITRQRIDINIGIPENYTKLFE